MASVFAIYLFIVFLLWSLLLFFVSFLLFYIIFCLLLFHLCFILGYVLFKIENFRCQVIGTKQCYPTSVGLSNTGGFEWKYINNFSINFYLFYIVLHDKVLAYITVFWMKNNSNSAIIKPCLYQLSFHVIEHKLIFRTSVKMDIFAIYNNLIKCASTITYCTLLWVSNSSLNFGWILPLPPSSNVMLLYLTNE